MNKINFSINDNSCNDDDEPLENWEFQKDNRHFINTFQKIEIKCALNRNDIMIFQEGFCFVAFV